VQNEEFLNAKAGGSYIIHLILKKFGLFQGTV
jgi:hypothetical protein